MHDMKLEMIMYTIKGFSYSEFDINKRCAELMGIDCSGIREDIQLMYGIPLNYCTNPSDTWPIIEKCWDDLICGSDWNSYQAYWGEIMEEHKCTKLAAACICLIELN